MIEMARAEERQRLLDQLLVRGDLLGLGDQLFGFVGEQVERDIVAQVDGTGEAAREQRGESTSVS